MNQLQYESSPYLRQHADNPVDWLPWSEEMLARARRENRPIVLSIGYSTCHWCHVMERESFRDEDVAAFMNEHFINVKVDREERPDLDQLYLEAVQLLSRSSGWPLNVFLTPEGKPFYGGTYFPPEPSGRQLSWFQALQYALYNFRENRQAVERQGDRILQTIAQGI
ncbi:MAG: thioredoxin domain-containing protein, partial [Saprospiraceae bacterium]|nr:thioredoxin domain-containing protein [Saprospiraceae bacterium]